jgi:adenylate cyclase
MAAIPMTTATADAAGDPAARENTPPETPDAVRTQRRDRWIATGAGLAFVFVFIVALFAGDRLGIPLGLAERLESVLLDTRFSMRGPLEPSPRVAMALIDQPTIDRYGRFPLNRRVLADALCGLADLGAEQIVVDLVFTEASETEADDALIEALTECGASTVVGYFFYTGSQEAPPLIERDRVDRFAREALDVDVHVRGGESHVLAATGVHPPHDRFLSRSMPIGYLNLRVDKGGIVRRVQFAIEFEDRVYPSIEAVAVAGTVTPLDGDGTPLSLTGSHLNPRLTGPGIDVELDGSGAALINYVGPQGTFPTVSLVEVLDAVSAEADPADAAAVRAVVSGRTVVLGPSAVGLWDRRDTPFSAATPAMQIHATVLDNMFEDRFLERPSWLLLLEWLVLGLFGVGLAIVLARAPLWLGTALTTAVVWVGIGLSQLAFSRADLWVHIVPWIAEIALLFGGVTALRFGQETAQRRRERAERMKVIDLFGRYVAPEVVGRMVASPDEVRIGGERRELTILFSDIFGFTGISEKLPPERLASLLNEYLGEATVAIQDNRGMLDKYIGDAVMALFGVPLDDPKHAEHALRAALAKLEAIDVVNRRWAATGELDEPLRVGIGINSGIAVVGNMGSAVRFEYTALGDEVNLASRIEGLTRKYDVDCLVSEATRDAVGQAFSFREVDRVQVKGRGAAVTLYELLGEAGEEIPAHVPEYERALEHMRAQRWDEAEAGLQRVLESHPGDGPGGVMLERVRAFRVQPPDPGWDGAHTFRSK